jgi:hypothetical protein
LAIKVDGYEVSASDVNINLRTSVPFEDCDDQPVFTNDTHVEIVGTSIGPEHRAGDRYEITIRGKTELGELKMKDIRARSVHSGSTLRG